MIRYKTTSPRGASKVIYPFGPSASEARIHGTGVFVGREGFKVHLDAEGNLTLLECTTTGAEVLARYAAESHPQAEKCHCENDCWLWFCPGCGDFYTPIDLALRGRCE